MQRCGIAVGVAAVRVAQRLRPAVVGPLDQDQRARALDGDVLEQRGVNQREDRRVGPDADDQRGDDGQGDDPAAAELPQRIAHVAHHRVEPDHDAGAAHVLAHHRRIAEAQARVTGVGGGLRFHRQVKRDLLVDIVVVASRREGANESGPEAHDAPQAVRSTLATAAVTSCQRASESARRRRPLVVSW